MPQDVDLSPLADLAQEHLATAHRLRMGTIHAVYGFKSHINNFIGMVGELKPEDVVLLRATLSLLRIDMERALVAVDRLTEVGAHVALLPTQEEASVSSSVAPLVDPLDSILEEERTPSGRDYSEREVEEAIQVADREWGHLPKSGRL